MPYPTPLVRTLLIVCLATIFSCSKDTDLYDEYALVRQEQVLEQLAVDDFFPRNGNATMVLDVLSNDLFPNLENVKIVEISTPENGTVLINSDKTLTYIPGSALEEAGIDVTASEAVTTESEATEEIPDTSGSEGTASDGTEEESSDTAAETSATDNETVEESESVEDTSAQADASQTESGDVPSSEDASASEETAASEEAADTQEASDATETQSDETAQSDEDVQETEGSEAETTEEETTETTTDEFTYTAETENEDGTVTTTQGTVTITEEETVETSTSSGSNYDYGALRAFPSAVGFGRNATGGRGGYVVEVTNLNDGGTGSLREALKMKGARTIVFRVGGTINCSKYLDIPYGSGNVTIAGQTAPGDGILIKGAELRISASNVIVRYLRIRPGQGTSGSNEDGINISAYNGTDIQNIVIDHCSISWARDENIALVGGFSGSTIKNVTIQNSIIAECNYGALNYKNTSNTTYYGNLFAHNAERNVRSNNPLSNQFEFEMINNVVYGGRWLTHPSLGTKFAVVNNHYKASSGAGVRSGSLVNGESDGTGSAGNTHAYVKGNSNTMGLAEWSSNLGSYIRSSPYANSGISPIDASQLESRVLSHVGASYPSSDGVDRRLLQQYSSGSGNLNNSGSYPSMSSSSRSSEYDRDRDGMADDWERANGLDPDNSADGKADRNGDGYTNLEDFLNEVDFR